MIKKAGDEYDKLKHASIRAANGAIDYIHDLSIMIFTSDESKTKGNRTVYADTRKADKYMSCATGADFLITFYEPNIGELSDTAMEALMMHELMHCGIGEHGPKLIDHDYVVEDFEEILMRYGKDWING